MNKITAFFMIIIIALSFVLGTTMQSKAQTKSFPGIIPFIAATDRLGFFDQGTGRIYMYDENFNKCVFIGQLQELGQPIATQASMPSSP